MLVGSYSGNIFVVKMHGKEEFGFKRQKGTDGPNRVGFCKAFFELVFL